MAGTLREQTLRDGGVLRYILQCIIVNIASQPRYGGIFSLEHLSAESRHAKRSEVGGGVERVGVGGGK